MPVRIKTNLAAVITNITQKVKDLSDNEKVLRPVLFDALNLITKRIHVDGVASDGGPIGNYSKGYLALREKKYHRNASSAVIISLTRQLENDYTLVATGQGYGIGFLNKLNFDKSQWVQLTYHKRIFDLTAEELDYCVKKINTLTGEILK